MTDDTEEQLALLRIALRARRFDEAVLELAGEIDGHHHVSHGLEAPAAALGLVKQAADLVVSNYRNHAPLIAIGEDPGAMLAEILGRDLGAQHGRSGSLHLCAPRLGMLYTSAMVGGGVPQAVGQAYALRERGAGICFCFFGDGALDEGVVSESLRLAAVWQLPVLFVCENNRGRPSSALALARAHELGAEAADGRAVWEVLATMRRLADAVRGMQQPRLLEVCAPPWPGNATFMPRDVTGPTNLRGALTVTGDRWHDGEDPVLALARRLLQSGVRIDSVLALDGNICEEVARARRRALEAPWPDRARALADVWSPGR